MGLIFKGFIIGIGKIMPGVSGAMLAMSLGIYENAIDAISNFFKNPVKNFKYLFSIFIGVVIAVVVFSKIIKYLLHNFYLSTILLFIGLIIGSSKSFIKKLDIKKATYSHYLVMLISFILVIILNMCNSVISLKSYFLIGFIDAITMIIPGLCGSVIMMLFGVYDKYLFLMSNLTNLVYIKDVIIYGIALICTILIASTIINKLLKKSKYIYYAIFGFSLSSILTLIVPLFNGHYYFFEIILSLILLLIGIAVGNIFDR